MKHKLLIVKILLVAFACVFLAGCGKDETVTDASGITVKDDLSVESLIVDDFDENVYNLDELKSMITKETEEYCGSHGADSVSAQEPTATDGKVKVIMNFAKAGDYAEFNNRRFSIDSLDQAVAEGKVNISLIDVQEGTPTDVSAIEDKSNLYLLVTDEAGYVTLPGKVMYICDGIDTISKKQVLVTDNMDGLAYIIFYNK